MSDDARMPGAATAASGRRARLPALAWAGLVAALLALVLGLPLASAHFGGYSVVQGLFYPRAVPNVAVVGNRLSIALYLPGALGLLGGWIRCRRMARAGCGRGMPCRTRLPRPGPSRMNNLPRDHTRGPGGLGCEVVLLRG